MAATNLSLNEVVEVTYLSGLTSARTIAATSFANWHGDAPATYEIGSAFVGK